MARDLHHQKLNSDPTSIAHLNGYCWGLYFTPYFPIITGSVEHPGVPCFFKDNVSVDRVVEMVSRKSKELGATRLSDLHSYTDSWWNWKFLLFWTKVTDVSGNASR